MSTLPKFEFSAAPPAKPAKPAKEPPELSHFSHISHRAALNPTGHRGGLVVAGNLAEAINRHCAGCSECSPPCFTTDAVTPLCPEGCRLKAEYRTARAGGLGPNR